MGLQAARVRGVDHLLDLVAVSVVLGGMWEQCARVVREPRRKAVREDRREAGRDEGLDPSRPISLVGAHPRVLPDSPKLGQLARLAECESTLQVRAGIDGGAESLGILRSSFLCDGLVAC